MTTDRYQKNYPVSWDHLHRDARALAWRLAGMRQWQAVICVTRGGLVPAAIIARELDIRLIDTICVATYDHKQQGSSKVLKDISASLRGDIDEENMLIIDDLVDTGTTARVVRDLLPRAHFATVYAKPEGRPLVDSFITEVSQDTWIFLPWDLGLEYVKPIGSS